MNKIIFPDSYGFDQPTASLVLAHRRGVDRSWMVKSAASAGIVKFASDVRPKPGYSQILLLAMGASDRFGQNRNGDLFYKSAREFKIPDSDWKTVTTSDGSRHCKSAETFTDRTLTGLVDQYRTFETHGHVYRHHKNQPHKGHPIHGEIKKAEYNHPMERVELLIEVPDDGWADELEKIANDQEVPFSMAANVPYDICNYCGHKASTRAQYCPHLSASLTDMLKTGHVVGAINERPVFFDISKVNRPADRIAFALAKVAASRSADLAVDPEYAVSPDIRVLMAANPGRIAQRLDLLQKASEIEKRVPVSVKIQKVVKGCRPGSIDNQKLDHFAGKHEKLAGFFRALSDRHICLPFEMFARTLFGPEKLEKFSHAIEDARAVLPAAFTRALATAEDVSANFLFDPASTPADSRAIKTAEALETGLSLAPEFVRKRLIESAIRRTDCPQPLVKSSGEPDPASWPLVQQYTAYKLAFLADVQKHSPNLLEPVLEFTVLQNQN